jgi:hypothetical protein
MKSIRKFLVVVAGLGVALISAGAQAIDLPTCVPNVTCLQFGDFNVFSLPLLNLQATGDAVPKPGDPFFVSSTYGQIQNFTIMGINNGQCTDTGNPPGAIDCSYNTPSPNNDTSVTFSTDTTADPGGLGEFTGDVQSWDASVADLLAISGGTPLVAYFAFNETGSGTGLLTTDLLIWAQVTVCDANNANCSAPFTLANGATDVKPDINNLPSPTGATQATVDQWVYVHAGICATSAGVFLGFPTPDPVTGDPTCPAGSDLRNQNNLGQNAAAFAITSPALDAALLAHPDGVMHVTWLMAYINGGGETAFILPTQGPTIVPEPGTLALMSLSLLLLAVAVRRKNA